MRIRITGRGIFGVDGEIPVGTEIDVKSEPKGWVGRYEIVTGEAPKEAVFVANPVTDLIDPSQIKPIRRGRPRKDG